MAIKTLRKSIELTISKLSKQIQLNPTLPDESNPNIKTLCCEPEEDEWQDPIVSYCICGMIP